MGQDSGSGVTAVSCGSNCHDWKPQEWDGPVKSGPTEGGGSYSSGTCSKCGMLHMDWMLMHLDGDWDYVHMSPSKESMSNG